MLEHLKKHLMPLQKSGQITVWSDTNLNAGVEWEKELHQHLESADIVLLLISPDFMSSDYCYSTEMRRAIERHDQGSTRVIPVLLRPIYWDNAPFAKLQIAPANAEPVTKWSNRDDAFHDITRQISQVIPEILSRHAQVKLEIQREGDVASIPFFPKSQAEEGRIHKTEEERVYALLKAQARQAVEEKLTCETDQLANKRQQPAPDRLFMTAAPQTPPKKQQQWLEEGNALYNLKQYEEALAAYEQAIRLDFRYAIAYSNKGNALYNLKRYEEALAVYEQAIRLDPNNAISYNKRGNALNNLKWYEEALAALEQAIRLDPNNAMVYYNKGDALMDLMRYAEALAAYEQAIRLDPSIVDFYNGKGKLLDLIEVCRGNGMV